MTLLLPPEAVLFDGPGIFLAGPIQGADDWQSEAYHELMALDDQLTVASPRRERFASGDERAYEQQVDWETAMLRHCAQRGGLLFWLAGQQSETPGRSYAQTTRFELGEWKEAAMRDGVPLAVGIAPDFGNARYIRRRLAQDCPDVPVCETLADTCAALVDYLRVCGRLR